MPRLPKFIKNRQFSPLDHEAVEALSEAIVPFETDRYKGAKSAPLLRHSRWVREPTN